jgi:8-oxo-dGTP diphosphatase
VVSKVATIDVVAGLICRQGRVLAGQRKTGGPFPLKWEFPGGKVEKGEDFLAALRRELAEELGITATAGEEIFRHEHCYSGELNVRLIFFRVDRYEGSIQNLGFERLDWLDPEELDKLDFLEGDRPLIEKIMRGEIACAPETRPGALVDTKRGEGVS